MTVKLLTEHHLEFLSSEARPSLHMSKCHIVKSHALAPFVISRLICPFIVRIAFIHFIVSWLTYESLF